METFVLLFWFWIPWQPHDPTFGVVEMEIRDEDYCREVRDDVVGWILTTYEQGSVAAGVCYAKGTFYESTIDWDAFKSRLEKDLEAGRKEFEKQYGGDR